MLLLVSGRPVGGQQVRAAAQNPVGVAARPIFHTQPLPRVAAESALRRVTHLLVGQGLQWAAVVQWLKVNTSRILRVLDVRVRDVRSLEGQLHPPHCGRQSVPSSM